MPAVHARDKLGRELRKLRGDRSLNEVQRKSGIDKGNLSRIERGDTIPSYRTLETLRRFYSVDDETYLRWIDLAQAAPPKAAA